MKKKTKLLLTGGAIAASLAAVAGVAAAVAGKASEFVVNAALDRKEPKYMAKTGANISVIPESISKDVKMLSEKLKNSDCERIEIRSRDGERLVGHLHHKKGDRRLIIAMHGWRSAWNVDFCGIADFWQENASSVLYVEQRGQGESGGEYMGFGMIERFDCLDWILWVNERFGENINIYLAGISMGASTVLMAGGFDLPKNVKGIMADCGFTSAYDIWKHVVDENLYFSYGVLSKITEDLCKKKISVGTKDYTTIDAMKVCKIPVLFIHGTDDTFVPVEMTYENYKACRSEKRLLIVPGATHAMSYIENKNGYEKAVLEFWEEFK